MATVVSSHVVKCPFCGITATVRVWSCGCQGYSVAADSNNITDGHYNNCSRPGPVFTQHYRNCGKSGDVHTH